MGINTGYLLMQILAFIVLVTLLWGWLYEPIIKVLEDRKARIAKGLEDARQAAVARDNADAEAKKIRDEARSDAAKIRSDASVQAEETAEGIVREANKEAKEIIANAREEAEEERNRILSELRSQVASISIAAANKLVGEALDEKRQHTLIADFFSKVPEDVKSMAGEKAVVTSALPLSDDEKANIKKNLKAKNIDFNVDPSILGGLVISIDGKKHDRSVASQMNGLKETLR